MVAEQLNVDRETGQIWTEEVGGVCVPLDGVTEFEWRSNVCGWKATKTLVAHCALLCATSFPETEKLAQRNHLRSVTSVS